MDEAYLNYVAQGRILEQAIRESKKKKSALEKRLTDYALRNPGCSGAHYREVYRRYESQYRPR